MCVLAAIGDSSSKHTRIEGRQVTCPGLQFGVIDSSNQTGKLLIPFHFREGLLFPPLLSLNPRRRFSLRPKQTKEIFKGNIYSGNIFFNFRKNNFRVDYYFKERASGHLYRSLSSFPSLGIPLSGS